VTEHQPSTRTSTALVPVQKHQISAAKTKKEPWNRRLPVKKNPEAANRPLCQPPKKRSLKPAVRRPKKSDKEPGWRLGKLRAGAAIHTLIDPISKAQSIYQSNLLTS
jgi:hypothetical protein